MTTRHDRVIGFIWLVVTAVFLVAMVAGLIQVVDNMTAGMMYRWAMALLFLGSSLAWLTAYKQASLRRFFKR
jgi:uncharacterized membrane protein